MHHRQFWDAEIKFFPLLGTHDNDGKELDDREKYKVPRSAGWKSTPLWSAEQLDFMEQSGQLDTGYAVLCDGLLIVDIDARSGGVASLERLAAQIPDIMNAGLVVFTGSGGGSRHFYFRAPENVALLSKIPGFDGIDVKSGRGAFVVGPGSKHVSGARYTIDDGHPDDIGPAPAALVDLLRRPDYYRAERTDGATVDFTEADISEMLAHIDPDCDHETWIRAGMAIHDGTQGAAFHLWDTWSAKGGKYPGSDELDKRWHSFGKSSLPVTMGTLIHYAEQAGYQQAVTFESDMTIDVPPLDTSSVDLLRPPGFVGEVVQWINDQCLYPREHLAVGAALVAMGNIVGLRYTDDLDGVTANMFGFGVSQSGSGKEAVYGAFNELMRVANYAPALHGMQKSEQEVIRNLIRHQAAFYNIDELGIHLRKVVNATTRGGASYLEGLIGILMSAYSKAGSFLPVSGDIKEDVKETLRKKIAYHTKALDSNEAKGIDHEEHIKRAEFMLRQIDSGIDRPFLSIMGFTTPETFDELVTPDQAASGFIGRALIVREMENNPQRKPKFRKRKMDQRMAGRIAALAHGGYFDADNDRIEYYEDRIQITTDDDARLALDDAYQEFWEYAETQKEATGLTAIPRRGYEMVAKISLVLAAPGGVRTAEHVRWAYAFVRRDVSEKLRLVVSNDMSYGAAQALMAKITRVISTDHGETLGVIRNRLRKHRPEDVDKALHMMEAAGRAKRVKDEHKFNKKSVERWLLVE